MSTPNAAMTRATQMLSRRMCVLLLLVSQLAVFSWPTTYYQPNTMSANIKHTNKWISTDDLRCQTTHSNVRTLFAKTIDGEPAVDLPAGTGPPSKKRKKHNKYAQFSKSPTIDPLEQTIQAEKVREEKALEKKTVKRTGRTVPIAQNTTRIQSEMRARKSKKPLVEDVKRVDPNDPFTFGYINIGKISGSHGIKGELKVQLTSDFADMRLKPGSVLYIKKPNRRTPRPIIVEESRRQVGNKYLVSFDCIKSRLAAALLKDFTLYVKKEDRPKLGDDEFLVRDLVGMLCYKQAPDSDDSDDGDVNDSMVYAEPIGRVEGVVIPSDLCTPESAKLMHSMLEIQRLPVEGGEKDLVLVPFVPSIVIDVDVGAHRLLLDPPRGLLEMTYREKKKIVIKGFLPARANIDEASRRELEAVMRLKNPHLRPST
jgi:16S rRNA processing protein RimM